MFQLSILLPLVVLAIQAVAIPQYQPLAGLSERQLADILPEFTPVKTPPPPAPINDTSVKLVNDKAHPYIPPRNGDIRGPCPGLNTLASHGVSTYFKIFPRGCYINKFLVSSS